MICSCQAEISASFLFCHRCGQPVAEATPARTGSRYNVINTTPLSHTGETTTLTIDASSPPPPGKYAAMREIRRDLEALRRPSSSKD